MQKAATRKDTGHAITLSLRVRTLQAQDIITKLRQKGQVDERFVIIRDGRFVFIPVRTECRAEVEKSHLGFFTTKTMNMASARPRSLKERLEAMRGADGLKPALSKEEMEHVLTSFDVMGDIAMLEIGGALAPKQAVIAKAIMELYPHVKTVVKKEEGTGGPYRIRPVSVIAGEQKTKTICKENGCSFAIDLNKAYYNPRMAAERKRIAGQIKTNENVLVLFAGVGPYAVIAEKKSGGTGGAKPAKIIAIELNPDAVLMMEENIHLNKCKTIEPVLGDVARVLAEPRFSHWADRIIMPHPSASLEFLPSALRAAKDGAIIHLYAFAKAEGAVEEVLAQCQKIAEKEDYTLILCTGAVVHTYSPSLVQVVLDLQVKKSD